MFTLNCKGRLLEIKQPVVMGILNVTPDSFYSGSRNTSIDMALSTVRKIVNEGAQIIDIGGQSTRPDSNLLSAEEETARILPVIKAVRAEFPDCFISIDTFYASVAENAVNAGADMINDISGGNMDDKMLKTVAALNVPYVCMHMKGTPQTMKLLAQYVDVVKEVLQYFVQQLQKCKEAGIKDVIIDPGFGFAKTIEQNFTLLKNFEAFSILGKPILLGVSRKSTIYKTLDISAEEALNGTTVLNTAGLLTGANILRVHDVKEAVEAIALTNYLK
jgi:dihydropteroate synthase